MSATEIAKSTADIRTERLRQRPTCTGTLLAACLWPQKGLNLGTLARTLDALGGCLAVPATSLAAKAVRRGLTIGEHNVCLHYVDEPERWLDDVYVKGYRIVSVELAYNAIPLRDLQPRNVPTVVLLGHENQGTPQWALDLATEVVEIPMRGVGNSLNVAVAGSLVLYKIAGLS